RGVAIDRGGGVDVVQDEIERAAVVQVDVGGAVGEPRLVQPPCGRHVRERQVPVVTERVVGEGDLGHALDERQVGHGDRGPQRGLYGLIAHVADVIEVVGPAVNAVGDEQILVAVVVQIREQGGPAPI